MADETNETPEPLSDAQIERIRHVVEDRQYEPGRMNTVTLQVGTMRRILATLDAYREVRGQALADIARLADERDTARRTLAALEAENAAMREIVAAVATGLDGARIFEMRNRARALLDTQTPETSATAGEEGEA